MLKIPGMHRKDWFILARSQESWVLRPFVWVYLSAFFVILDTGIKIIDPFLALSFWPWDSLERIWYWLLLLNLLLACNVGYVQIEIQKLFVDGFSGWSALRFHSIHLASWWHLVKIVCLRDKFANVLLTAL